MHFKAIVFDLDGTISNPSVGYLNAINYALKSLNKETYSNADYTNYLGTPLHTSFKNHFFKFDPHLIEDAMLLFREYYGEKGKYENALYEGIYELIQTLSTKHDLYILTNKTHSFAVDIIDHFGLSVHFKGIYGLDPSSKISKSEIALKMNESVFKNIGNILMIGDTVHDINCAHEANWKSCFVSYGFGKKEDLINSQPHKIVGNVNELSRFLEIA